MTSEKPSSKKTGSGIFYGYYVVVAAFIILTLSWGVYYSYGVFFKPLMNEFGWSSAVTSGAYSISIFVTGACGIVAGRLSDRLGPKIVISVATVILALGYILMSFVQTAWQFYLLYSLLIAPGIGGFWAPPVSTIARWFHTRRGLMTGIVSGGISFGQLILPPLLTNFILVHSWRSTYLIIGLTTIVLVLIAVQFLKNSPQKMGLRPYGETAVQRQQNSRSRVFTLKEATRTPQFWMGCGIYLCFGAAQLMVAVHIVPYATTLGISPLQASIILSVIGAFSLTGRISFGRVADRTPIKKLTIIGAGLMIAALIGLQFAHNLWELCAFAAVFGLSYGALSCIQSLMAAELFGLSILGVVTALFSFSFSLGGSIGPFLAGFIVDVSSSYRWAFLIGLILVVVTLILGLNLKPPKKVGKGK